MKTLAIPINIQEFEVIELENTLQVIQEEISTLFEDKYEEKLIGKLCLEFKDIKIVEKYIISEISDYIKENGFKPFKIEFCLEGVYNTWTPAKNDYTPQVSVQFGKEYELEIDNYGLNIRLIYEED